MKQIPLTQGQFALVDDEDFEELNQFKWSAAKFKNKFYAVRTRLKREDFFIKGKKVMIKMHRQILGLTDPKIYCDHRDRDSLNNQRHNLRSCDFIENSRNKSPEKGSSSKYKGVHWNKKNEKWRSSIRINGKSKYLGSFYDEIEAAKKYDEYAKIYHKEFAYLNFP